MTTTGSKCNESLNMTEIRKMLRVTKKGVISKRYLEGTITEQSLIIYSMAVEDFKKNTKKELDDFLKLPIVQIMHGNNNKLYWIDQAVQQWEKENQIKNCIK